MSPAQDWSTAAGVAKAFAIGPKEAKAVRELVIEVSAPIRGALEKAVRQRGMVLFLNHDVIGNRML